MTTTKNDTICYHLGHLSYLYPADASVGHTVSGYECGDCGASISHNALMAVWDDAEAQAEAIPESQVSYRPEFADDAVDDWHLDRVIADLRVALTGDPWSVR